MPKSCRSVHPRCRFAPWALIALMMATGSSDSWAQEEYLNAFECADEYDDHVMYLETDGPLSKARSEDSPWGPIFAYKPGDTTVFGFQPILLEAHYFKPPEARRMHLYYRATVEEPKEGLVQQALARLGLKSCDRVTKRTESCVIEAGKVGPSGLRTFVDLMIGDERLPSGQSYVRCGSLVGLEAAPPRLWPATMREISPECRDIAPLLLDAASDFENLRGDPKWVDDYGVGEFKSTVVLNEGGECTYHVEANDPHRWERSLRCEWAPAEDLKQAERDFVDRMAGCIKDAFGFQKDLHNLRKVSSDHEMDGKIYVSFARRKVTYRTIRPFAGEGYSTVDRQFVFESGRYPKSGQVVISFSKEP